MDTGRVSTGPAFAFAASANATPMSKSKLDQQNVNEIGSGIPSPSM